MSTSSSTAAPKGRSRCRCGSSDHGRRSPAWTRRGAGSPRICARSAICATSAWSPPSPRCRASASSAPARGASCHLDRRLLDDARRRSAPALSQRAGRARRGTRPQYRRARRCGRAISTGSACSDGNRVLQIGAGAGYFTAILAELVGPTGHVDGHRDRRRAGGRRRNAISKPGRTAHVRAGDASAPHRRPVGRDRGLCRRHGAARLVARWRSPTAAACCCR